ncbi:MAG: hypothetical protein DMF53_27505 [Acidobacteria bacterium]|nr:MAG: hypothetical protein DMF53_27505 [Acidobacteriota bacterium]
MRLSVLDFGDPGSSVVISLRADALGYSRYWIGEHHTATQCANPLLLAPLLALHTHGLRLGTGGVCLNYHSPFRIAEDARLIETLLPGCFDLGVTRGLSLDDKTYGALLDGRPRESLRDYLDKLADLHGYLTGRLPEGHPLFGRELYLKAGPPLWVLGQSVESARWAGRHGTGFCFSLHQAHRAQPGTDARPVLDEYRRSFKPSPEFEQPAVLVVASGLCAATEKDVETLRKQLVQTYAPAEAPTPYFAGTPERSVEILEGISRSLEADELMILDVIPGPLDLRLEMLKLLADVSGLVPRASAT